MLMLTEHQLSYTKHKKWNDVICPICKRKCYEHCNNCHISISWKKDEMGRRWIYESGTDIVHYNPETRKGCMNSGTKRGQYIKDGKARVEQEPKLEENFYKNVVIYERDLIEVKKRKMQFQDRLRRYSETQKKFPVDLSWWSHSFEY